MEIFTLKIIPISNGYAMLYNGIIIFYYLWRKYDYLVVASKYAIVGTQGICLPTWRCQSQESILTNWGTFTQNAYNCLVHCICLIHTLECRTLTLLYMLCRWNSYLTINTILSIIWNKLKVDIMNLAFVLFVSYIKMTFYQYRIFFACSISIQHVLNYI